MTLIDPWAHLLLLGTQLSADTGFWGPFDLISANLLVGPPAIFSRKPIWAQSAGLSLHVFFHIRAFIITRLFNYMP